MTDAAHPRPSELDVAPQVPTPACRRAKLSPLKHPAHHGVPTSIASSDVPRARKPDLVLRAATTPAPSPASQPASQPWLPWHLDLVNNNSGCTRSAPHHGGQAARARNRPGRGSKCPLCSLGSRNHDACGPATTGSRDAPCAKSSWSHAPAQFERELPFCTTSWPRCCTARIKRVSLLHVRHEG